MYAPWLLRGRADIGTTSVYWRRANNLTVT